MRRNGKETIFFSSFIETSLPYGGEKACLTELFQNQPRPDTEQRQGRSLAQSLPCSDARLPVPPVWLDFVLPNLGMTVQEQKLPGFCQECSSRFAKPSLCKKTGRQCGITGRCLIFPGAFPLSGNSFHAFSGPIRQYFLFSSATVSLSRPFALLLFSTRRPPFVLMRARKPNFRFLLVLLGW